MIDDNSSDPSKWSDEKKGIEGEKAFHSWLQRCNAPSVYIEQSQDTFPSNMKDFHRPDFMTFVYGLGTMFFDAKSLKIMEDTNKNKYFQFSRNLIRAYNNLETYSSIPVWIVFIPYEEHFGKFYFIRNADLVNKTIAEKRNSKKPKPLYDDNFKLGVFLEDELVIKIDSNNENENLLHIIQNSSFKKRLNLYRQPTKNIRQKEDKQ